MLVARPEATISPADAFTDVLKAYGGAVGDGVGRRKLGSTVLTVADAAEKNDDTTAGDSTGAVALRRGSNPIIGDSFASIPRLDT